MSCYNLVVIIPNLEGKKKIQKNEDYKCKMLHT